MPKQDQTPKPDRKREDEPRDKERPKDLKPKDDKAGKVTGGRRRFHS